MMRLMTSCSLRSRSAHSGVVRCTSTMRCTTSAQIMELTWRSPTPSVLRKKWRVCDISLSSTAKYTRVHTQYSPKMARYMTMSSTDNTLRPLSGCQLIATLAMSHVSCMMQSACSARQLTNSSRKAENATVNPSASTFSSPLMKIAVMPRPCQYRYTREKNTSRLACGNLGACAGLPCGAASSRDGRSGTSSSSPAMPQPL
mmetsp:Transcript_24794/g.73349  ORF Transcript_24794/g.73349 Transcript_24794/m.73349 type:complete len:201 (+) Transcript_24794:1099-1701(+)